MWIMATVLDYLYSQSKSGRMYIQAAEFREFVRKLVGGSATARDRTIDALLKVGAIGKLNAHGTLNRRYYLTENVGRRLLKEYKKQLSVRRDT